MRAKIIIGLAFVLTCIVVLRLSAKRPEPLSVTFRGYEDWSKRAGVTSNTVVQAVFIVTNRTARWVYTSEQKARVQIQSAAGWKDYSDSSDILRVDMLPMGPHDAFAVARDFPRERVPWRLHISYATRAPSWTRLRLLDPFRSVLKLEDRQWEACSQEMTNEPTR